MKKLCLLLALLLCLSACAKQETAPPTPDDAAAKTLTAIGTKQNFTRADADFIETNFDTAGVERSAVYFSENGTEFGFFLVDNSHQKSLLQSIRTYLESEEESVRSLAELYPAEDLDARLSRFDHAKLGAVGDTFVYYFLTAPEISNTVTQDW